LEEYTDPKSGKDYPRVSRFTFNQDGKTIEYRLAADQEIDVADVYKAAPEPARAAFDRLGLHPSYPGASPYPDHF
jgi:hypothetical protein